MNKQTQIVLRIVVCVCLFSLGLNSADTPKKALTYRDMMQFKHIQDPVISEDGASLAYGLQPDRGDGEARIHRIEDGRVFSVDRGSEPVFSKDSRWVAMVVKPKAVEMEKAKENKPKQGMVLLDTQTGETIPYEKVQKFSFSDDSLWMAVHFFKEDKKTGKEEDREISPNPDSTTKQGSQTGAETKPGIASGQKPEEAPIQESGKNKEKKEDVTLGSPLILRNLDSDNDLQLLYVLSYAFDSVSEHLAFAVAGPEGKDNGLYVIALKDDMLTQIPIKKQEKRLYSNLTWTKEGSWLAFLEGKDEAPAKGLAQSLWIWDGANQGLEQAVAPEAVPESWLLPEKNSLSWSDDGKRLFFGFKPEEFHPEKEEGSEKEDVPKEAVNEEALFDYEEILKKREVDVWHWNDPLIVTNQKKMWPRVKDKTCLAVYHLEAKRFVQLADRDVPVVRQPENPDFALGLSNMPYRKEITWHGELQDVYTVSLEDGSRKKVVERLEGHVSLSPSGRCVVYYKDKHWHLYDGKINSVRNLTKDLGIPFFDEDHDYPSPAPGYGTAGWLEDDKAVLIYDKYDIWAFATEAGAASNITDGKGRETHMTFRIIRLDPEERFLSETQPFLLSAYHNLDKHHGFYTCHLGKSDVSKLLDEPKKFTFKAKAKKMNTILYTREDYTEYPDLWVSDSSFRSPKKITDANPQIKDFAWGSARLVEWRSADGLPLQGVFIKPGNYEPGKRYPVVVYFYRFFSQRLHEFNQIVVNHRPCFPLYASNGYAVFLPDIRFDIGHPGYSATKCLVPGVQKLIDMGIADPDAIGLHGHSWSGYQTAFVVTQTDIFACAIAGAPVSNMTSAYSGIRWETGLARQMQYEQQQSRIGGSLWEYPERYIENSPVFFADRINTPLLIQFGDEDGAVPWYQGIELYLAMRRLEKDCVFLQYRGEPHHLRTYANKLDYTIKMMEYFDHYLKGKPAPNWIIEGIPYRGK
jgi:dipeptidyl aminopeptidase/acylaminoacyl peptidase